MQVLIPMSGLGSRFVEAGYTQPKPLISVLGKPIIEWVVSMFDAEDDIIFVCREEHLQTTEMRNCLNDLRPNAKIISIKGHKKGPVYALKCIEEAIDNDAQTIVTYCDYFMQFDYEAFKKSVKKSGADGAIPCYTGFHPHLMKEKNLYASCNVNENGQLIEIKEKYSFTVDKTQSLHSPGLYYFKSGEILKQYIDIMIDRDISLNGEYYASLLYNPMVDNGLTVDVPANVTHFCQWGTPEDLEDFLRWMNILGVSKI